MLNVDNALYVVSGQNILICANREHMSVAQVLFKAAKLL